MDKSSPPRRGAPRHRTFRFLTIVQSDGGEPLKVTARDLSITGAKIELPPEEALTEPFQVTDPESGDSRQARLVWRRGLLAGIVFLEPPANGRKWTWRSLVRRRQGDRPRVGDREPAAPSPDGPGKPDDRP